MSWWRERWIWVRSNCILGQRKDPCLRMTSRTTLAGSYKISLNQFIMESRQTSLILEPRGSTCRWWETCLKTMNRKPQLTISRKKTNSILLLNTTASQNFPSSSEKDTTSKMTRICQLFLSRQTFKLTNFHLFLVSTLSTIKRYTGSSRDGQSSEVFPWWCNTTKQWLTSSRGWEMELLRFLTSWTLSTLLLCGPTMRQCQNGLETTQQLEMSWWHLNITSQLSTLERRKQPWIMLCHSSDPLTQI